MSTGARRRLQREPGELRLLVLATLVASFVTLGAGCGHSKTATAKTGSLRVAAAENFWGSIASQLGGSRVQVKSVITSPGTDPHAYEPTAADARAIAGADLVIANGVGYDPWISKLVAANPVPGRLVLTVGDLVGIKPGGNPHRWYSPGDVQKTIDAIVSDYKKLDHRDAAFFTREEARFERRNLARYRHALASIGHTYHGVPIGASESIFAPLAEALRLKLLTPPSFLKAISEGTEPTAADKTAVDREIALRQIKVWVYNSQSSTPDVKRITEAARKRGIPITTITETLTPPTASFQDWQAHQLEMLAAALAEAAGR